MKRRDLMTAGSLGALTALGGVRSLGLGLAGLTLTHSAQAAEAIPQRFLLVLLRGGMDGLAAVPPIGDPHYAGLRGKLALNVGENALALTDGFGLHSSLAPLATLFHKGELAVVPAVAGPYRTRSHFDAQNALDLGLDRPHVADDGWLNRMLPLLTGTVTETFALALGQAVPQVLRGPHPATSWSPSRRSTPDEAMWERIVALYDEDAYLHKQLGRALAARSMAGDTAPTRRRPNAAALFSAAANMLARRDGPRVIVLELHGWDTHANQGTHKGRLSTLLRQLGEGIATIAEKADVAWKMTLGIAISEFGRTARVNGTGGTDHGTAGAAFVFGGATQGGRVVGPWPGLSSSDLVDGRDLRPTVDTRSLLLGALADHYRVDAGRLARDVFRLPTLRPVEALIRNT